MVVRLPPMGFLFRDSLMTAQDRFLKFQNIDMAEPDIHAYCSRCGREFSATPKPNERVDDVLLRMRAEYDATNARQS